MTNESGSSVSARSNPECTRGPVFIDAQKHVGCGCVAVDSKYERARTPSRVMRIADCTIDEHFILDRDRMQIARSYADEGEGRRIIRDRFERPAFAVLMRCEQVKMRRKQKSLPRL